MGQLHLAFARDLDSRLGDHLARQANPHQRDLRARVFCVCIRAQLDYGRPVALRNLADNGTDVPALRVLHDHGPEDDGEVEEVAVHRCVPGGFCRDVAAFESRGLRAVIRTIPRWTNSDVDRDLCGRILTQRRKGAKRVLSFPLRLCAFARENFLRNDDPSLFFNIPGSLSRFL